MASAIKRHTQVTSAVKRHTHVTSAVKRHTQVTSPIKTHTGNLTHQDTHRWPHPSRHTQITSPIKTHVTSGSAKKRHTQVTSPIKRHTGNLTHQKTHTGHVTHQKHTHECTHIQTYTHPHQGKCVGSIGGASLPHLQFFLATNCCSQNLHRPHSDCWVSRHAAFLHSVIPMYNRQPYSKTSLSVTYLESASKEFILDLQKVPFALFTDEWLIDDLETLIILDVLPTPITMTTPRLRSPQIILCTHIYKKNIGKK